MRLLIKKTGFKTIRISLKYDPSGQNAISVLLRKSKPGLRVYVKKQRISKVLNGLGLAILSTSIGVVSGRTARLSNVGGEFIGVIH